MENPIESDDHYWDVIKKAWPSIISTYRLFQNKKPILEYKIPDRKIYAYPAKAYINALSLRTREKTRKEYKQACLELKMMIFVRDMENNILRSYVTEIQSKW